MTGASFKQDSLIRGYRLPNFQTFKQKISAVFYHLTDDVLVTKEV